MTQQNLQGTLYVVSAPSGAGKTSLISGLVDEMSNLMISVSYTTRAKRPGEMDGVHYNYVTDDEFQSLLDRGVFMEYAKVFDHQYATSREWVEERLTQGFDILLEIDWQGARQVRELFKDNCVSIFILPPSMEILEERLRARKQDSKEVIAKRMSLSHQEVSHYHEYDYVVINKDFDKALRDMKAIISAQRLTCKRLQQCKPDVLKSLLKSSF